MNFSPYAVAPFRWFLPGKFHPEILTGFPERGHQTAVWGKQARALSVNISKTVGIKTKITISE